MNSSQLFKVIGIAAVFAIMSFVLIQSAAIAATPIVVALLVFISAIVTGLINKPSGEAGETTFEVATLYVGNLPYRANEAAIRELFSSYTAVQSVRLMKDKHTGKRRGFGFVEIAAKDVNKTIDALNDQEFQQRTLKVREAKERPDNNKED